MSKQTICSISREDFLAGAQPLALRVGEVVSTILPKEFKGSSGTVDGTGSFGWFCNEKMTLLVGGVPVRVQVNCLLTVIGSKQKPDVGEE